VAGAPEFEFPTLAGGGAYLMEQLHAYADLGVNCISVRLRYDFATCAATIDALALAATG
jgi:hypothetical protein